MKPNLSSVTYIPDVIVATEDNKAIFVLYEEENNTDKTYSEFIKCNYDNFLNNRFPIEELIYDDETVNEKQLCWSGGGFPL